MSDLREFADLVQRMRNAQVEYFRTRSNNALSESKRLERRVDLELKALADKQPRLFGDDEMSKSEASV